MSLASRLFRLFRVYDSGSLAVQGEAKWWRNHCNTLNYVSFKPSCFEEQLFTRLDVGNSHKVMKNKSCIALKNKHVCQVSGCISGLTVTIHSCSHFTILQIIVNACCPGWVHTDMASPSALMSPEEGAVNPVQHCFTEPQNHGASWKGLSLTKKCRGHKRAQRTRVFAFLRGKKSMN